MVGSRNSETRVGFGVEVGMVFALFLVLGTGAGLRWLTVSRGVRQSLVASIV